MLGLAERRALFIVLKQAEVELSVGLNEWLKGVTDGAERFTAKQLRNALANVKQAVQTVRQLDPAMQAVLGSAKSKAAAMSIGHVETQLFQFGYIFDGSIQSPNIKVAAVLAKGDKLLLKRYPRSAARYAGQMERHIKRQLTLGVIKGESFDATIGRLTRLTPARMLEGSLAPASAMAKGLMQMPRTSAARLIRTEVMNAYNTFSLESIKDLALGDDTIRKRWDSSLDRRSKGCACRRLNGEVQKVGDPFSTGVMHSPEHPNCRCTVVPWSVHWKHDSMRSTGTEGIDAPDPKPFTRRSDQRAPAK